MAQASRREVIVVGAGKLSPRLGTHWRLPVTAAPGGNIILDSCFGPITDPTTLASLLDARWSGRARAVPRHRLRRCYEANGATELRRAFRWIL